MRYLSKSLSPLQFAILIIVLITTIYLHPFFLGKVDTPLDIRNALMYPWRYHEVDKKIQLIKLWERGYISKECSGEEYSERQEREQTRLGGQTFKPKCLPNKIEFKLDIENSITKDLIQIKDRNYYIAFDFRPMANSVETLKFEVSLLNINSGQTYTSPAVISPISNTDGKPTQWYKAYFILNPLIKNLSSFSELNYYLLQIVVKNTSVKGSCVSELKNLFLALEDFSGAARVKNYFINDLLQMFTPFREYFSDSIKKGNLPFWNNYVFSGTEFLADPQVGYFHPFYFLSYYFFNHFTAHAIVLFTSLMFCGIGAFLLASYWGFGFSPSLLTAIVYMFHPFNVTWFSYEHMIMNSAVLPFLILAYEKNINENKILNWYLLLSALLLGLIFVSGHLQYIYYTVIFFILFVVFKIIVDLTSEKGKVLKHLFSSLFIFLISFMVGMAVLIPFFPLFLNSHRVANSVDFIKATSFPLKGLLGLIYPYYGGHPSLFDSDVALSFDPGYKSGFFNNYIYFGLIPFLFSVLSILFIRKNLLTLFFLLTIIFSFLMCTGSPVFFFLREFVPGFKQLQHFRFLEVYSYSVPFLAGIGLKIFMDFCSFLKQRIKILILTVVLFLTVLDLMYYSSYFITWSEKKDYKPIHKGGSLEYLLKIKKEAKKNVSQDIGFVRFTRQNRSSGKELHKEAQACLAHKKESKEPFRILPFAVSSVGETKLSINVAQPDTLLPYGLEEISGYSSFIPKDIYYLFVYIQSKDPSKLYPCELTYFFRNPNIPYPIYNFKSKVLDLLNVRYFLVPPVLTLEGENVEKVFSGDCAIYENKDYLPRAFFVEDYKVIKSPKETIIALDSEKFNPRKEVILMTHIEEVQASLKHKKGDTEAKNVPRRNILSAGKEGKRKQTFKPKCLQTEISLNVCQIKYEQNTIALEAEVSHPGFLVLGHNLDKNWKVKINKKEGRHYQANLVQRAVYLPKPGTYLIEFYYFPKLFIIGGSVSILGLLILFLLALYLKFVRKESSQNYYRRI